MFLMLPLQHRATCRHGEKKASLRSLSCVEASRKNLLETRHPDYPRYCRRSTDATHASGLAASIVFKEEFSGTVEIVSYLDWRGNKSIQTKDTIMKLTTIALASAFALPTPVPHEDAKITKLAEVVVRKRLRVPSCPSWKKDLYVPRVLP